MAQNVKHFKTQNCLFFVKINIFLKSQKFAQHFNNILLGVKFFLLSLNTDEFYQTNLYINIC